MEIQNVKDAFYNARLYKIMAKNERRTQEAEQQKREFSRQLEIASSSPLELIKEESELKGKDAASKRDQLMILTGISALH